MASGDPGRPSLGPLRVKNERGSVSQSGFKGRFSSTGFGSTSAKKMVSASRLSMAGTSSSSSMNRTGRRTTLGGDFVKENRPISSRAFKEESIRSLLSFLTNAGFPHNLNARMLHSPTSKDFFRIFEFMYGLLHPSYKVGAAKRKIEEEIPRLVKELGYPINITRSALLSVGSPHVWPSLLAMLAWLCNMIEVTMESDVEDLLFPASSEETFVSVSENRLKFQYAEDSYQQFMQGADTFEELEDAFRQKTGTFGSGDRDMNDMKLKCEELQSALNILEDEPDELSAKRELLMASNEDAAKLENFVASLEQHLLKDDPANLQRELQELEAELCGLQIDNQKKEKILETQEFSQFDVDKIKKERQEIQRQSERAETEKQNIEEQIWEHEMQIGKQHSQIEDLCQEYNKVAMSAHLVPASAENAFGVDYRLWPDTSNHGQAKFSANVKPALKQILMKCKNSVLQSTEMKLTANEDLEQLNEQLAERQDSLNQEQAALKRMDDSYALKKEQLQSQAQGLDADLERLRSEISILQASALSSTSEDQNRLKIMRNRFAAQKQARERNLKEMVALTRFALSEIIEHKTKMEQSAQNAADFLKKQADIICKRGK